MIIVKNKRSIAKMETAGRLLSTMLHDMKDLIKPGVTTAELDAWIEFQLREKGLVSKTKGYMGYRHVSCISVNDEVVHGVPCDRVLAAGDLVKVDVCASWNGYCADMARHYFVGDGTVDTESKRLVATAERALNKGIEMARPGNRISDISAAIQKEVEAEGFGVVRDFAGHGIGKSMHEDPEVLNYGKPGQGPLLQVGMALAIEPMITMGDYQVYVAGDGWTVKTVDSSLAAHVEDTVVITEAGPKVLTRFQDSGGR